MTDYAPSAFDDDEADAYTVRPYTVTGGRVSAASKDLPMEALVETASGAQASRGLTPEKKRILELASGQYQSVAELSAHTRLPLGVVRVLVTDLSDQKLLTIHITGNGSAGRDDSLPGGLTLSLLESVLDGIAAL